MQITRLPERPLFRYLFPFIVFMVITELQRFGDSQTIFLFYGAKTLLTGLAIIWCFKGQKQEIGGSFDGLAVLLGIAVFALWILPYLLTGHESEVSFNPQAIESPMLRVLAVSTRIAGAVVIVPIMEELLWRSFLMRYLIKKDFTEIPLGTYTHFAFWGTVAAFMLVHRMWEWPVAFVTGALYGWYMVKRKNIFGCIVAHATTNLLLAVYVLATGNWGFW